MEPLRHIVEPSELLLTWQPSDENATPRMRRVVARITRTAPTGMLFEYLRGTDDFAAAMKAGFLGFPAFQLEATSTSDGVAEALMRRLPPRRREDFSKYLEQYRLPVPFEHSDFALLGYTGARLPSDGFALVPVFPDNPAQPIDFIVEVAGLRHIFGGDISSVRVGDAVTFEVEPSNPIEPDAVRVLWRGAALGYVNRAMRGAFASWLERRRITATVERINGKPSRPLVYIRVSVREALFSVIA